MKTFAQILTEFYDAYFQAIRFLLVYGQLNLHEEGNLHFSQEKEIKRFLLLDESFFTFLK
jgi:hypothetical protein